MQAYSITAKLCYIDKLTRHYMLERAHSCYTYIDIQIEMRVHPLKYCFNVVHVNSTSLLVIAVTDYNLRPITGLS